MTKPLIEEIELSGTVMTQFDGKYMVNFRVTGLTRDDANVVSALLQPLIRAAVANVLANRGQILSLEGPGRSH
jgi:hypothetical protein